MKKRVSFFGCMDLFSKPFYDHLCRLPSLHLVGPGEPAHLAVVASWGRILPSSLLQSYPGGVLNMHPSLLPKYRGAAPAEWQILCKEKTSGITAIRMVAKMDAGPILEQESFALSESDTRDDLLKKSSSLGLGMLERLVLADSLPCGVAQRDADVSFAPKVSRVQSAIQWSQWTREDFSRHWRALSQRFEGLETQMSTLRGAKKLKIVSIAGFEDSTTTITTTTEGLVQMMKKENLLRARLKDGWVMISSVSVAGGKGAMDASQFAMGYMKENKEFRFL